MARFLLHLELMRGAEARCPVALIAPPQLVGFVASGQETFAVRVRQGVVLRLRGL